VILPIRAMSRPIELRLCLAIVAWMFDSVPGVFAQDGALSQLPVNQANRQQFILAQESASITAETERIIVTGSNIPTAQEEPSLPVTRYTAEFLRKAGAATPVEGLRQLPSFVGNTSTESDSNGGSGAASIKLRGIGPTYGDLRFNPCWDSLRGDPRFDKIVAAAKAASR
jgi:hypothetical protein